ncbi:MAG: hypothetical protein ACRDPO_25305 [Streptosporangiaceae bacterium]
MSAARRYRGGESADLQAEVAARRAGHAVDRDRDAGITLDVADKAMMSVRSSASRTRARSSVSFIARCSGA